MIEIGGNKMHIFCAGPGPSASEYRFVFLSGHGTSCPMLDFKPLWHMLAKQHNITVVEKFGYGLSDITATPRDMGTVLAEVRKALTQAEIMPPYVLVAHSLSGMDALYWAQFFPQEVAAIIGLDPTVPETAKMVKFGLRQKLAIKLATRVSRRMSSDTVAIFCGKRYPSYKHPTLTNEDRAMFAEITRRRTLTQNMINELRAIKSYVAYVEAQPLPTQTPLLLFSSNFREATKSGMNPDVLLENHRRTVAEFEKAKHIQLDCGHYVHGYKPQEIVDGIYEFLGYV